MRYSKNSQSGVSLIEVLITLVVLGMGLMSLAKFQATVLKDNSVGKERTIAAHLAEQKIEDLRSYNTVQARPSPQTVPPTSSYRDIGSNTGGRWNSDGSTLVLPAGDVASTELANSNVTYKRDWAVRDWYYSAVNSPMTTTVPSPAPPYPDLKQVVVTIRWPDPVTGAYPAVCSTTAAVALANTRVCLTAYIAVAGDPAR